MKKYNLYRHRELNIIEAVKVGFSWPGFLFAFFWLLIKRLWVQFLLCLIAGILLSVLEGTVYSTDSYLLDSLYLILLVALIFLPGFYGNRWRENRLRNKGYIYMETVQASSPKAAIKQVLLNKQDLVPVFETFSLQDLPLIKSALEAEDVVYHVSGEFSQRSGVLPTPVQLFVSSNQKEQVLRILKGLQMVE